MPVREEQEPHHKCPADMQDARARLDHLSWADDLVLLARSRGEAERRTEEALAAWRAAGLDVGSGGVRVWTNQGEQTLHTDGKRVQTVAELTLLGTVISEKS